MKSKQSIFIQFFLLITIAILAAIPSPFSAASNSPPVASAPSGLLFKALFRTIMSSGSYFAKKRIYDQPTK